MRDAYHLGPCLYQSVTPCDDSAWCVFWAGGQVVVVGFCTSVELTPCLCPCLWIMPYEPSLARALVAHERAVRRGPDPV